MPALLLLAALAVAKQVQYLLDYVPGVDFRPLRAAAQSLLSWHNVYTDPSFVYPPTAAPAFLPTVLGSTTAACRVWVWIELAALVLTAALVARHARPGWRTAAGAVAVILLAGGTAASDSLRLSNVSVLLAPATVVAVTWFARGRWRPACALLVVTLLIKPLLVPLLLVPLLHRRWRDLAVTLGAGLAALGAAMLVLPGGRDVGHFIGYVVSGTNLHGIEAVNSLSLTGWAETHHAPGLLTTAARAAVIATAIVVAWRAARRRDAARAPQLGLLVLLTVFLSGSLSEVHYLMSAAAIALLIVLTSRTWHRAALYVPGLLLLGLPLASVSTVYHSRMLYGPLQQNWYVLAELLLFAAAVADLLFADRARAGNGRAWPVPAGS